MKAYKNPWLRLGFETYLLGAEACSAIALRAAKFATGGNAAGPGAIGERFAR
jgi:hypothetical protein